MIEAMLYVFFIILGVIVIVTPNNGSSKAFAMGWITYLSLTLLRKYMDWRNRRKK